MDRRSIELKINIKGLYLKYQFIFTALKMSDDETSLRTPEKKKDGWFILMQIGKKSIVGLVVAETTIV